MTATSKFRLAFSALILLILGHLVLFGTSPFYTGFLLTLSCVWLLVNLEPKELSTVKGQLIYLAVGIGFYISVMAGVYTEAEAGFRAILGMWVSSSAGGAYAVVLAHLRKKRNAEVFSGHDSSKAGVE